MELIDKDTNKDVIIAYLVAGDDSTDSLTQKQRSLLQYYTRAYDLVRSYNSTPDVIRVLVKLSIELGEPISKSTARRYVHDALDIFGNISKSKAEAIKHLSMEVLKDAIGLAFRMNDAGAMIKGAKELYTIGGIEEDTGFNPETFERHVIEMGVDEESLRMLEAMTHRGNIDLDSLSAVMAEGATEAEIIPKEQSDDQHN